MESPNALLKDLAREREERSNSSLKRQRQATDTCDGGTSGSQPASSSSLATGEGEARVIVDLCDSDDDGGISYDEFVDNLARDSVTMAAMGKRGLQSKEAMGVMNALVVHLEGKLSNKSFALAKFEKKSTLDRRHVHGAARLVLPSALAGRAVKEGLMAVERFGAPAAEVAA